MIIISYDGTWPNLCSGTLIVGTGRSDTNKVISYRFPRFALESGGSTCYGRYNEDTHVSQGPWSIKKWPDGFPEELKEETLELINKHIEHGCCGGCL